MEQLLKNQIEALGEAFRAHKNLSLWRVSFLVRGNGQFLKNIRSPDTTFTIRTYDACVLWFSLNWPEDLEWPEDVPRPEVDKAKRRAS